MRRILLPLAGFAAGAGLVAATLAPAWGTTVTRTFSSGDLSEVVPNREVLVKELHVPARREIRDLDVLIRMEDPAARGLLLALVSPRGKAIKLSTPFDVANSAMGSGSNDCGGDFTRFDDEAAGGTLASGSPPYTGSFKPLQALSAVDGTRARGRWSLVATDFEDTSTAVLYCWKLRFRLRA